MSRVVKGEFLEVLPARNLPRPFDLSDFPCHRDRFEARKAIPYALGDVIWGKNGRRALVISLHVERVVEHDPHSDLLPVLRVREETAAGTWSRLWSKMWPGDIERAYENFVKKGDAV